MGEAMCGFLVYVSTPFTYIMIFSQYALPLKLPRAPAEGSLVQREIQPRSLRGYISSLSSFLTVRRLCFIHDAKGANFELQAGLLKVLFLGTSKMQNCPLNLTISISFVEVCNF